VYFFKKLKELSPQTLLIAVFVLSASLFLIVDLLPSFLYQTMDVSNYLTFHMIVETFSIIVSFSIFGVGYYTYNQSKNMFALFLSCAFLVIGLVDMMHMLSFPNMPAFITANSTNKGILFWISARFITAIALIMSVYIYVDTAKRWLSKKYLLTAALSISAFVFVLAIYYPSYLPLMFIEGSGLTTSKIILEWIVIALFASAFILYWRRFLKTGETFIILILAALIVSIFSELSFTLYKSAFDTYNMLGHIYKLIAFVMIYASIFFLTISQPYKKLEKEIVEREKAEENIKLLANVVESSDDAIVSKSLEGRIISWNKGAELIYGYSAEEILGEDISILAPPPLKDEAKNLIEKIKKGEHVLHYETTRIGKDGKEINVSLTLSAIFDSSGNLVGISTIARDITQRKKAEIALRESEKFLDNVVENIPNMIFVKNADDLSFKRVNKTGELYFGHPRDDLVGKSDYDFFPKNEADFFTEKDREVLQRGELLDIPEETIDTTDLGQRLLHTKKIPLLDEEGNPQYLLGIAEDITELKRAENELKESLRVKEALLREIHHRVKNNMQIISSLLNLQTGYVHEEETKNVLIDSQSRVKSMAMIHEKLYMSDDLSHVNFKEYAEKLVLDIFYTYGIQIGTIEPILNLEEIELNMETAIPLGLILNELIINSLKSAFPGDNTGTITVQLRAFNEKFILNVADDGIGFPENIDLKTIDSLGLQLVKTLVSQLDGEITLDRSHGTDFKITFKELKYKERI
jgi:PAS domain S-box-containing protein